MTPDQLTHYALDYVASPDGFRAVWYDNETLATAYELGPFPTKYQAIKAASEAESISYDCPCA